VLQSYQPFLIKLCCLALTSVCRSNHFILGSCFLFPKANHASFQHSPDNTTFKSLFQSFMFFLTQLNLISYLLLTDTRLGAQKKLYHIQVFNIDWTIPHSNLFQSFMFFLTQLNLISYLPLTDTRLGAQKRLI